jgi:hypothetical protein
MYSRSHLSAVAFFSLLFLASCAQPLFTIPYNLPPEIDIPPNIKSVGVVPFESPRHLSAQGEEIGDMVTTKIAEYINETEYYRLVNRSSIDKLLQERQLSFTDFSEGSEKKLKLKGVDAIITGKVTRYHFERKRGRIKVLMKTRVYNRIIRSYVESMAIKTVPGEYISAEIAITFRMLNTLNGDVIAIKGEDKSWDSRTQPNRKHRGRQYAIPTNQLPGRGKVMRVLLGDVLQVFLNKIAPHTITKTVRILNRGPDSNRGIRLAQNKHPPDGAYYNQGVILEALGRLKEAAKAYDQAFALNPDSELYMQALTRVKEMLERKKES